MVFNILFTFRVLSSLTDVDMFEPIKEVKQTHGLDQEALNVIAAYSNQDHYTKIAEEIKKVNKADQLKNIRKSDGYKKFINKFKK